MFSGAAVLSSLLAGVIAAEPSGSAAQPPGAVVRTEGASSRPWVVTFDPGVAFVGGQLEGGGPGRSVPPPIYLGATIERTIRAPFAVDVSAGALLPLGVMLGATARFVDPTPSQTMRVSAGIGPALVADTVFGTGAFVQGDVAVEARFANGFTLVVGPRVAVAVTDAGTPRCGTDTCDAYMRRGDVVVTLRTGLGYTF